MKLSLTVFTLSIAILSLSAHSNEITAKKINERDVIFKVGNNSLRYDNIVGEMKGSFRDLIKIDSKPSLFSAAQGENYYTLNSEGKNMKIDCLYSNLRSPLNGVRIRKGICGIDSLLDSKYTESAFEYTDAWQSEVSQVDTTALLEHGTPIDILVSKDSKIEIRQIYSKKSDLEDSTPDAIVAISGTCYNLGKKNIYAVNQKQGSEIKLKAVVIEVAGENFTIRDLADELHTLQGEPCIHAASH